MKRRFLLIAGEASGDMYGADVARALVARFPGCEVFGLGGQKMAEAGVRLVADIHRTAVVGPFEVIGHLRDLYRVYRTICGEIEASSPDAAVLIDFPDFNLRVAHRLKDAGTPVIYYISPQVWAWRKGRIEQIRQLVRRMLVIFPFEEKLYRDAGVNAEFVGHPLIDLAQPTKTRSEFAAAYGIDVSRPLVALLPGSRTKEVNYILPTLCESVSALRKLKPDLQFVLPVASNLPRGFIESRTADLPIRVVYGETTNALKFAKVAIVASGTATLEAALLGTPEVAVYRISEMTWFLGRFLLTIQRLCIVNIILDEDVVPELYQSRMTVDNVVRETVRLLDDVGVQSEMRGKFELLRRRLGSGRVPERVAEVVESELSSEQLRTTG